MKNKLVAILIARCAFGWTIGSRGLERFEKMGTFPEYRMQYYLFVLPMIHFVVTEMNPKNHLDARKIMNCNLQRAEEYMKKRINEYGIWSQELLLLRNSYAPHHPRAITRLDQDVTRGWR